MPSSARLPLERRVRTEGPELSAGARGACIESVPKLLFFGGVSRAEPYAACGRRLGARYDLPGDGWRLQR